MARPTDPAELAALRARQAANSRAYRARKAAARAEMGTPPRVRQAPSSEQAVIRAHEQRAAAKARRYEIVGKLTSARNPAVTIYTPREAPTAPALIPDTAAKRRQRIKVIRENAKAQQLVNIGRRRKREIADVLRYDPRAESITENLKQIPDGLERFRRATARLSAVSMQTLGIFLTHEGGEGDLQSSLTQLAYPRGSDLEDALGRVESLADQVEKAEQLYGPRAVGRLRI